MSGKRVHRGLIYSLLVSNGISVLLFIARVLGTSSERYWFLFWNLALAWVPFFIVLLLIKRLKNHRWKELPQIGLSLLWLAFLPNSFYIISDLIHLQNTAEVGVLYDSVLFMSIIWNGLVAGMISIYLFHKRLLQTLPPDISNFLIGVVILLVSFAIYIGRVLRWNTWDLLANPSGLVFDVSDHIVNPLAHPQAFITTATFFVLLGSIYLVVWHLASFQATNRR